MHVEMLSGDNIKLLRVLVEMYLGLYNSVEQDTIQETAIWTQPRSALTYRYVGPTQPVSFLGDVICFNRKTF